MKRSQIRTIISVLTISLLFAAGFRWLKQDNSLEKLQKAGFIRIGYAVEAPYAFVDEEGEVTGLEPEIAKIVAKKLSIQQIHWYQTEFGSLITGLEAGEYDMIAAGMYITRERAKRVAFSNPITHASQGLLVAKGNPENLHSYSAAIKAEHAKIAVLSDSIEEVILRELKIPTNRLLRLPDALSGRIAVESGEATAFAISEPTLRWMDKTGQLSKSEKAAPFEQTEIPQTQLLGYSGFVFSPTERKLREAWNDEIRSFLGSKEHQDLVRKFAWEASELLLSITAETILANQ